MNVEVRELWISHPLPDGTWNEPKKYCLMSESDAKQFVEILQQQWPEMKAWIRFPSSRAPF